MITGLEPVMVLALALSLPFLGAGLVVLLGRIPNLREAASLLVAIATFVLVLDLKAAYDDGILPAIHLVEMLPGLTLSLGLEPLGILFALIASGLWIVATVYSIGYMRGNDEKNQTRFFAFFAIAIGSTLGIAFSANMLTLFVFYEVLTVCTYPLVTHSGKPEAVSGGRVYLGTLLATSIGLLLFGVLYTFSLVGNLDFIRGGIIPRETDAIVISGLLFLYMYGIGKAALMPVHGWLPAAMVAPTPVSALLHAVAVVKAGVFAVVKVIVYVFGIDLLAGADTTGWLAYVAGFTILAASVIALRQDNLKKRLAFSTVSQLSYVVLAAAVLTPLSVVGAVMHIAAHAVAKITLFFAAGSIYTAAHKTEVSELDGIGRAMPWTMTAFAIAALSMIGLPPTAGFVSKWFILQGALGAEHYVAVSVIILSTLLNAGYFLPIVHRAFFRGPRSKADHGEAPFPIVLALTATAGLTVLFFFLPDAVIELARATVGGLEP